MLDSSIDLIFTDRYSVISLGNLLTHFCYSKGFPNIQHKPSQLQFKLITISPSGNGDQWKSPQLHSTMNKSTGSYLGHSCYQESTLH